VSSAFFKQKGSVRKSKQTQINGTLNTSKNNSFSEDKIKIMFIQKKLEEQSQSNKKKIALKKLLSSAV
jgi:hypothetical protein